MAPMHIFLIVSKNNSGPISVIAGMVTAVGISNLQFVNLNSSRNLFIFGAATFTGLSVSEWLKANPSVIDTGKLQFHA